MQLWSGKMGIKRNPHTNRMDVVPKDGTDQLVWGLSERGPAGTGPIC